MKQSYTYRLKLVQVKVHVLSFLFHSSILCVYCKLKNTLSILCCYGYVKCCVQVVFSVFSPFFPSLLKFSFLMQFFKLEGNQKVQSPDKVLQRLFHSRKLTDCYKVLTPETQSKNVI